MFDHTFKNIDDALRQEAGCTTELDYTEQASWILFLKYLDDLERERSVKAELEDKIYNPIIDKKHQWSVWAVPKKKDGSPDRDKAMTGDDLVEYVNDTLFPYLRGFKQRAGSPDTIEYKIGEIFSEIKPKFNSGYTLRDVLEATDQLRFGSQAEKHELSELYEVKIKRMGNAGRNGGEYYTPRPLIRTMIKVIKPKIGETIYDGAVGSAGFLCEAFAYMRPNAKGTKDLETLQKRTFSGVEKKSLAYVIAIMNMILHGIEAPSIVHDNSLARSLSDIQPKDQKDIILANPPFGGSERREIQQNFPIRSGETAYLFLQHFIKMLKPGGRAAVVVKSTFLSNGDATALRKEFLNSCNLHSILDCPKGTFLGTGEKTSVLFFEKGSKTKRIWYYQLDPGRSLGKTNALTDADFDEFIRMQSSFDTSKRSWLVDVSGIDSQTFDLWAKNPNAPEPLAPLAPEELVTALDDASNKFSEALTSIALGGGNVAFNNRLLGDIIRLEYGKPLSQENRTDLAGIPAYGANGVLCWSTKKLRDGPTIIVGRKGSAGEVNFVDTPFWATDVTFFVEHDPNETDLRYLYYLLKLMNLPRLAKGVKPGINRNEVYALCVPIPQSLEQQRLIVSALDGAFEKIEAATALAQEQLSLLKDLRQSVLASVLFSQDHSSKEAGHE